MHTLVMDVLESRGRAAGVVAAAGCLLAAAAQGSFYAVAMSERGVGSRLSALATRYERIDTPEGPAYHIKGSKSFVSGAGHADADRGRAESARARRVPRGRDRSGDGGARSCASQSGDRADSSGAPRGPPRPFRRARGRARPRGRAGPCRQLTPRRRPPPHGPASASSPCRRARRRVLDGARDRAEAAGDVSRRGRAADEIAHPADLPDLLSLDEERREEEGACRGRDERASTGAQS